MITRITAGAILTYKNKILLMKRGLHKKLAPGLWAFIGGHLELEDIKNPSEINLIDTCYREVFEETKIAKQDILNLKLRYMVVRKDDNEIRIHHHFISEVTSEFALPECDEGKLHWIDKKDIFDLPMSLSLKTAATHWLENPDDDEMFIVIINRTGDSAEILEL